MLDPLTESSISSGEFLIYLLLFGFSSWDEISKILNNAAILGGAWLIIRIIIIPIRRRPSTSNNTVAVVTYISSPTPQHHFHFAVNIIQSVSLLNQTNRNFQPFLHDLSDRSLKFIYSFSAPVYLLSVQFLIFKVWYSSNSALQTRLDPLSVIAICKLTTPKSTNHLF
ncbi:hypothetical protein LOAG_08223 [Loa loa]|uniref:Uncharacterized protein n=1 Tax=Loa loa TaxID=7209 RepID=A0A1S0TU02_LOALO|nr:hypothetical protein LOAG_08223 [Loa loa]EFO20267.1 hypothetical protein LOAG_08223 [Loa loa]